MEDFVFGNLKNDDLILQWTHGKELANNPDFLKVVSDYGKKFSHMELARGVDDPSLVHSSVGDIITYNRCTSWTTDRQVTVMLLRTQEVLLVIGLRSHVPDIRSGWRARIWRYPSHL